MAAAGARVDLRTGSVGDGSPLPWPDATFDAAAALHCFQFWSDPAAGLAELARVLRPDAPLLVILRNHGRRAPDWLPNPASRSGDEPGTARALLRDAGFGEAREEAPVGSSRVLVARRAVDGTRG